MTKANDVESSVRENDFGAPQGSIFPKGKSCSNANAGMQSMIWLWISCGCIVVRGGSGGRIVSTMVLSTIV